ncbi:MAG: thiamine pyrophosphate-binding protein [Proteobacteria bacterium]|nr:thiamine pyrophosphate-binding protein [Pseudomonadota bacterium]
MGEICGGHVVAKYIKEVEGIDTVFGLSGGHIDSIYDGCIEYDINLIAVRHEQSATLAAHSWSTFTGKPGVALVVPGPGFTNSISGLVNAWFDNAPLVLISGYVGLVQRDLGALQDMDQVDMIKSYVKWHGRCHEISRIGEYLSTAFRQAASGRPGPVFLEMPTDVLRAVIEESELLPVQKGNIKYQSIPDPSSLEAAAELINAAEKPLILGGNGCVGCEDELLEFTEKTGAPFVLMNKGRGVVSDENPQSLWDGAQMGIFAAITQADLIIALGIRFEWILLSGKAFPQAKMVRADIDAAEINRNRAADVGMVGDMKLILDGLNPLVEKKERSAYLKELRTAYLEMIKDELAARTTPSDPVHPARVVEKIGEAVNNDALFMVDGGDTGYFGLVGLKATEASAVIQAGTSTFGCIGTGIPFAIGAKVARPDKTVIVVQGDGSFGFNAMEFETAVRQNIPFVCVILNDKGWGMIKHGQEMIYGHDRVIGTALGTVHYEKMVEALGGYGERVEKDEDVIPAIKRAIASGKPACVNVMTDDTVVSPETMRYIAYLKGS